MMLGSCTSTKEIAYFQDVKSGDELDIAAQLPIRLAPNDVITIQVSTSDPRLDALFNLPVTQTRINNNATSYSSINGETAPYTINKQGDITFPVLGKLHIAGMTRTEVAEYIRRELMSRDLAKNPIVTVDYLNLAVSVMGEVSRPGRYNITREDYTILDALSAAGDLTIYGLRKNVKVVRNEGNKQKVYIVNLNNSKELVASPVYFLKQNDVVYVEPNSTRKNISTPNGNIWSNPSFWVSAVSGSVSIATLIVTLTKK